MPLEFSPEVPIENSPVHCVSIASVATRWLGCGEQIQIEIERWPATPPRWRYRAGCPAGPRTNRRIRPAEQAVQPRHRTSAAGGCAGRLADDSGSAARLAGLVDVGDSALGVRRC